MQVADIERPEFEFVKQLGRDLASNKVNLPSFPAVVIKIRDLLEDEECDIAQVSKIVSVDAVLVSKLFIFANSSYHNRSGEAVTSLEVAMSRLGLQLVRNTALSLAVKQLMLAEKHKSIVADVRLIWSRSMRLAALSYAIAEKSSRVDEETAFMCGLLHQIGKLYILTRAKDYPEFLGDKKSLREVQNQWHAQIGHSIVEAWGFPSPVVQSLDPSEFRDERTQLQPAPVDVVYAATCLLSTDDSMWPESMQDPVWKKLRLAENDATEIAGSYQKKLATIQQSLA
ncbi:MAG: HDOD domain-containing protein [Woeseiaceae bacterium]